MVIWNVSVYIGNPNQTRHLGVHHNKARRNDRRSFIPGGSIEQSTKVYVFLKDKFSATVSCRVFKSLRGRAHDDLYQWARFSRPATKGHLLSWHSPHLWRSLSEPSAIHHSNQGCWWLGSRFGTLWRSWSLHIAYISVLFKLCCLWNCSWSGGLSLSHLMSSGTRKGLSR